MREELDADSEGSLLHPVLLMIGRSHLLSSTCRESTSVKMKLIYCLENSPSVSPLGKLTEQILDNLKRYFRHLRLKKFFLDNEENADDEMQPPLIPKYVDASQRWRCCP